MLLLVSNGVGLWLLGVEPLAVSGSRQSRWGWSDVRGCRRVGGGAARPRRDDGRCLIVLDHGGPRRHVIIGHDRPVAPATEGCPGGRGRSAGPVRVRYALTAILCLTVVGVLAGCRSLAAMREHVADLEPADLGALGLEARRALPSESTIREPVNVSV